MLGAAIVLICLGLLGLGSGILPRDALIAAASQLPDAAAAYLNSPPPALIGVSGAIYLSGIILLAGSLLKRSAVAYFDKLLRQRADLEALQAAVLLALERLEQEHRDSARRQQVVSSEIRTLAQELERERGNGAGPVREAEVIVEPSL